MNQSAMQADLQTAFDRRYEALSDSTDSLLEAVDNINQAIGDESAVIDLLLLADEVASTFYNFSERMERIIRSHAALKGVS